MKDESLQLIRERAYIDGAWVGGASTFEVSDPADGSSITSVADLNPDQCVAAVEAAHRAWPKWRALTAEQRAKPLRTFAALMREHVEALAELMTREQGKPLAEARGEIEYAAGFLSWAAEEGKRVYGETVPSPDPNKRIYAIKQPVGVAVAITPWNFPAAMITRKLGPALAAGCTMVVKPASQTPLSALALARLGELAGLMPGVFNVVTSSNAKGVGEALLADARVRKVSFTGSTAVGQWLVERAAQNLPRLSLELGGHAPAIVFDDADVELAVREVIAAKFRNAGQTCVCINRVYVQRGIAERFLRALEAAMRELKVGPGRDAGVDIGPLIDDAGLEKVQTHVDDARDKGAKVNMGGAPLESLGPRYFAPTLIEGATRECLVMREETFGPVLPVSIFDREGEAIEQANDTPFGLAAYFFTRNASRCHRVAEALEYGIVGVNDGRPSTPEAPFGGYKQSGWGREGGKFAMDAYLETKYVSWAVEDAGD